jgi:EmrB/QacA subfamily drug resistance transporter
MSATAESTTTRGSGELSHRQIMTILTGLLLGMFLAALDQMIVSTAIRTIGDDLNGLSAQAWVTTAFLITSTITTPLYGKLSDIYGRKKLFMFAIVVFIGGSALCGLATSMYMLAGFRALQGIGAGGLLSLALAIIGDIIPPRERAKYQGYFMVVFASASVLGPVVGGFLAGQSTIFGVRGWRWIFYINVPIGILALIVVAKVLHLDHYRREHRIDWYGSLALVVGLVPLLLVSEQGRTWGWSSAASLSCYLIGVVGLIAFVWIQSRMGDEALIPLHLFRSRNFSVGSAQSFILGIGMYGGMSAIPLYLQIVKGASPTKAGLLLLPMVLGIMTGSVVAGQTTSRTGRYRIFPIIGGVMLAGGLGLMTQIGADTPLWHTDLFMLVFGLGLGLSMQTIMLAMQSAVSPKYMGVSSSSATFFRNVGGTLGAAVFLSILFTRAADTIPQAYVKAAQTPAYQQAAAAHPKDVQTLQHSLGSGGGLNDTNFLSSISKTIAHPFLTGFSSAMDTVFVVGAIILVFAFVLALLLKETPLRTQSGLQAQRVAAEEATDPDFVDAGGATHEPEAMTQGVEASANGSGAASRSSVPG